MNSAHVYFGVLQFETLLLLNNHDGSNCTSPLDMKTRKAVYHRYCRKMFSCPKNIWFLIFLYMNYDPITVNYPFIFSNISNYSKMYLLVFRFCVIYDLRRMCQKIIQENLHFHYILTFLILRYRRSKLSW